MAQMNGRESMVEIVFEYKDSVQCAIAKHVGLAVNTETDESEHVGSYTCRLVDGGDSCCGVELVIAARIFCLSKDEIYFLGDFDEIRKPLNHRNEAAALSLIQQRLKEHHASDAVNGVLNDIDSHCADLWNQFHNENTFGVDREENERLLGLDGQQSNAGGVSSSDDAFLSWAQERQIESLLVPKMFHGMRGCEAARDIGVGEHVLSIPKNVLVYDENVLETDAGKMLSAIPHLTMDNLLIIFTMIDRFDEDSSWKPFWNELPDAFQTGLSFDEQVVDLLQGSAAYLEIQKAQRHIQTQYEASRPLFEALLKAYPQYLQPEWFTYDMYVWAIELWYSYAFEIEFPGYALSKMVMVPFACLVNHSPWPHVVRYGKVDAKTDTLQYPAFRPCSKGEQVFISYGPVPNLKLITYYGFALENNPHEIVPMTFEIPAHIPEAVRSKMHAVLDYFGIDLDHNLRDGPIAKKLMACLRVVTADDEELQQMHQLGLLKQQPVHQLKQKGTIGNRQMDPVAGPISEGNESRARSTLSQALSEMHQGIVDALKHFGEKEQLVTPKWKLGAKFCNLYLKLQQKIIRENIRQCMHVP